LSKLLERISIPHKRPFGKLGERLRLYQFMLLSISSISLLALDIVLI